MNLTKRISVLALIILLVGSVSAQKNFSKEADALFKNNQFFSAIDAYKKAEVKEKKPAEKARVNFQIAECYRMIIDQKQAETYYKRAIKLKYDKTNPLAVFQLAEVLKEQGLYKDATEQYEKFLKAKPGYELAEKGLEACNKSQEWVNNPTRHKVESELQLNTDKYDFSPVFADKKYQQLIFSSSRPGSAGAAIDDYSGESFMDLWLTTRDKNGKWSEPKPLGASINTEDNEGATAFDRKMSTMYFTRCPVVKKENVGCDIMISAKQGVNWKTATSIGLKPEGGDSISMGHPALTPDGRYMLFSSDMPGGQGGKDLWITEYDRKAKVWKKATNLGPGINTKGDEMFPYVRANGELYFSSNGHPGLGGLDMFKAAKNDGKSWGEIENLGTPLNSYGHDFGIIFDRGDSEKGFFTSSRSGSKGHDDIYSFRLPEITFQLECIVRNTVTNEPVPGATINLIGSDGSTITKTTDETGKFLFDAEGAKRLINKETNYNLDVSKTDFLIGKGSVSTMGQTTSKKFVQEFFIQPADDETEIEFPEVRYDLAKWALQVNDKVNSKDSLNFLFTTLNENPTIIIELMAHTDCRGSDSYNQKLSQKRAQSCVDYLVGKGIAKERMVPVGYGEKKPKGPGFGCKEIDKLPTKEEQEAAHQKNRRTTFRVLSFDYKPAGGGTE